MPRSVYFAIPLMVFLAVLQTAVVPNFPVWGQAPQLVTLTALAWGLIRGWQEGVAWALVAGLTADLFSIGPMGINALALMPTVAIAALLFQAISVGKALTPLALAPVVTVIHLLFVGALIPFAGYTTDWEILRNLGPFMFLQILAMVPIYWGLRLLPRRLEQETVA